MSIRRQLREHGLRPRKRVGQHFLVSEAHLTRIVDAACLVPDDLVLEIGPGLGALTSLLVARAGHVIAVELDEQLVPLLQEVVTSHSNLTIVQGDSFYVVQ